LEQTLFYKYPEVLMRATGYVSPKTGELIELTANDKNVYVVMKKRNTFFDKHFDKQEDIAKLCGVSVKQVGRIIRGFIDSGLMVANKGQAGQHKNWRYEKVLDIVLYVDNDNTEMLPEIPEDFWRSDVKQNKVVKEWSGKKPASAPQQPEQNFDDEFDLPF
jgi:hypothetical protein